RGVARPPAAARRRGTDQRDDPLRTPPRRLPARRLARAAQLARRSWRPNRRAARGVDAHGPAARGLASRRAPHGDGVPRPVRGGARVVALRLRVRADLLPRGRAVRAAAMAARPRELGTADRGTASRSTRGTRRARGLPARPDPEP